MADVSTFAPYESVRKGLDDAWNARFTSALSTLKALPPTPRTELAVSQVYVLLSFTSGRVSDKESALSSASSAVSSGEKVLKKDDRVAELAASYGLAEEVHPMLRLEVEVGVAMARIFSALMHFGLGSRLKGLNALRKAWKLFRSLRDRLGEAEAEPEVAAEIRFGLGLIMFTISLAPKGLASKILKLVGFEADRTVGLDHLRAVSGDAAQCVASPWATSVLLANNLYFPRGFGGNDELLADADALLTRVLETYPNCALFHMLRGQYARKTGNPKLAEDAAQAASAAVAEEPLVPGAYLYRSEAASAALLMCQWEVASERMVSLLEDTDSGESNFEIRGLVALCLASAQAQAGEEEAAAATLEAVDGYVCKSSRFDDLAAEMAKGTRAQDPVGLPLLAFEIMYLKRELKPLRGEPLQVFETAFERAVEAAGDGVDAKAVVLLVRGAIATCKGEVERAVECFTGVVGMDPQPQVLRYCVPYARFELAELAFLGGRVEECVEHLDEIDRVKGGFVWEAPLYLRVKQARKQL